MIHLAWWGYTIGETRVRESKEEHAGDKYRQVLSVSGWVMGVEGIHWISWAGRDAQRWCKRSESTDRELKRTSNGDTNNWHKELFP